ncbi:MAG: aminoacyl-tRNA hydrolase [Acidobacteria bacterium]|nr:aminoacyl-tRNA hydrolase [Acidobacteriota bacterium]
MKLIVGLGNPGIEYQFTLHNIGFLAIDRIAERQQVEVANRQCRAATGRTRMAGHDVLLAKPETYMNLSGQAVRQLVDEYDVDAAQDLVVLYDELDLPFGMIRVRPRGSSAGHNGAESIIGALGSEEWARVRMGVQPERGPRGPEYLLGQIRRSQMKPLDEMLDLAANAVEVILAEGVQAAMNRFNKRSSTL